MNIYEYCTFLNTSSVIHSKNIFLLSDIKKFQPFKFLNLRLFYLSILIYLNNVKLLVLLLSTIEQYCIILYIIMI